MSSVADMIMPSLLDFDGSLFNLPSPPPLKPHWLDTTNVDRQDLSTLSTEDFIERYEKTGVPCILTGVVPTWKASTAWTRKSLLSRFPDTLFRVSATRDMALSDYFLYCDEQNAKKPSERDARPLYLFQKDFPKVVPEMADEYCIPPYFADDLMGAIPAESRPDYRWLIIGPALSGSSFHVDPNANFAWNATIQVSPPITHTSGPELRRRCEPRCEETPRRNEGTHRNANRTRRKRRNTSIAALSFLPITTKGSLLAHKRVSCSLFSPSFTHVCAPPRDARSGSSTRPVARRPSPSVTRGRWTWCSGSTSFTTTTRASTCGWSASLPRESACTCLKVGGTAC